VLDQQQRDWRNLDHLMAQGSGVLPLQQGAATSTGIGVVFHHLIHPLDRQQLRPSAGMARLSAALAAAALAPLRGLKPRVITDQFGELAAELIVLLLLSQDEGSDGS